jgi:hypothetical protein
MLWLSFLVAFAAAAVAFEVLLLLVWDTSHKRFLTRWACLVLGAYFLVVYIHDGKHDVTARAMAWIAGLGSIFAFGGSHHRYKSHRSPRHQFPG